MVGQSLTTGCSQPLKGAVLNSVWKEQDKSHRTDSLGDEEWKVSSKIMLDAFTTGEPPLRAEEELYQESGLNVQSMSQSNGLRGLLKTSPSFDYSFGQETYEESSAFIEEPHKIQQASEPLRAYKRNRILHEAINHFQKFRQSLNTPEAPMHIHLAKEKLEESWEFIAEEDKEIELIISALEGAIRQRKWREYKQHQVATLQAILEECVNGKLQNRSDVLKKLSTLYKQDIDIFPSAPEQAYEEDYETGSDVVS